MNRSSLNSPSGRTSSAIFAVVLTLALTLVMVAPAFAQLPLVKLSTDTFNNSASQHKTEVEPDTFAFGSTIVSAFQVARVFGGGGADVGFATSTDAGKTWTSGYLPGLTNNYKGGTFTAASDAAIAYDAKHAVWLISTLPLTNGDGEAVATSRSTDGIHWGKPIIVDNSGSDDKNWITCDNTTTSPHYGNCYTEWDEPELGDLIFMSTSTDGGLTWGPAKNTGDSASGIGGQPLVLPNGTVVVPISTLGTMIAFLSTNGGSSWTNTTLISNQNYRGEDGGLRDGFGMPSAQIDGGGKSTSCGRIVAFAPVAAPTTSSSAPPPTARPGPKSPAFQLTRFPALSTISSPESALTAQLRGKPLTSPSPIITIPSPPAITPASCTWVIRPLRTAVRPGPKVRNWLVQCS